MSCLKWCVPSPPSWSWIRTSRPRGLLFRCTGTWWQDWSLTRWTVSLCSLFAYTKEDIALLHRNILWAVTNVDFYKSSHLSCISDKTVFSLFSTRRPVYLGQLLWIFEEGQLFCGIRLHTGTLHGPGKDSAGEDIHISTSNILRQTNTNKFKSLYILLVAQNYKVHPEINMIFVPNITHLKLIFIVCGQLSMLSWLLFYRWWLSSTRCCCQRTWNSERLWLCVHLILSSTGLASSRNGKTTWDRIKYKYAKQLIC